MRTVKLGEDYVANFEKTSKTTFAYRVVHTATQRKILTGACTVQPGDVAEAVVETCARNDLNAHFERRRANSERYARGFDVPGAPAQSRLPPVQKQQIERSGQFAISAELPVRLIREAYQKKPVRPGLGSDPKLDAVERERQALAVGHQVLVGATDEQILKIARGQATLVGSNLTGIAYKEVA